MIDFMRLLTCDLMITLFRYVACDRCAFFLASGVFNARNILDEGIVFRFIRRNVIYVTGTLCLKVGFISNNDCIFATSTAIIMKEACRFVLRTEISRGRFMTFKIRQRMLRLATTTVRTRRATDFAICKDGLIRGATITARVFIFYDLTSLDRDRLIGLIFARRIIRNGDVGTFRDDKEKRAYARKGVANGYYIRALCKGARDRRFATCARGMTYPAYFQAFLIVRVRFRMILRISKMNTGISYSIRLRLNGRTLLCDAKRCGAVIVIYIFSSRISATKEDVCEAY